MFLPYLLFLSSRWDLSMRNVDTLIALVGISVLFLSIRMDSKGFLRVLIVTSFFDF